MGFSPLQARAFRMQERMETCCVVGWLVCLFLTRGLEEKNVIMMWRASVCPPTFPHFCHQVLPIVIFVLPVYLICLKSSVFFWIFLVHLFHIVERLWAECILAHFVAGPCWHSCFQDQDQSSYHGARGPTNLYFLSWTLFKLSPCPYFLKIQRF